MIKFKETNSQVDLSAIEKEILNFWTEDNTFYKSVNQNQSEEFVFYDGPPFANGLPHYGHLLTGFIKDTIARYQTMQGKKVERRFGWDCHGLPAEMGAEKELNITGRQAIENFGIKKFNDHCKKSVMQYSQDWEQYVTKQARWVDFKNSYKTMDKNFMESVLWAFKELYKKGLIYESLKVVPYSWKCQTPLANFETKMDNSYREKTSKAITVAFKLKELPSTIKDLCDECYILAWTTTPWTLPSNLLLAIGQEIQYVAVIKNDIATISADFYYKDENDKIKIPVSDLINLHYEPLFPYFKNNKNSFKVTIADFVVEGDGTGIVHIAPGFGEEDFNLCINKDINIICPVDEGGKFTNEVIDFAGRQVFDCETDIIIYLKKYGNWRKTENYIHQYPHCWRTDTPLIYKTISSWYLKVEQIKDRLVNLNQEINWIPHHVKDGAFGKWISNARDWAISRNRFWGTPIPIWKSDNDKYPRLDVYGSIEEIEKDFNVKINDLHKHNLDTLTRINPDDPSGKSKMVRIPEVFDCWFESGSMPYAQKHYPFENKVWFENNFPADFITEYISQTRGWFYTLLVLSVALFDKIPFRNCICHGVVLDSKGQKLSKRLNNYPDPIKIFEQYGSDSLRFLMLSSTVSKNGTLLIDQDGKMIQDISRLVIKPLWNAYHFFVMYANADNINSEKLSLQYNQKIEIDSYIMIKMKICIDKVNKYLAEYDTSLACHSIIDFIDTLNNWYIRRSRNRFWKKEFDQDKLSAYTSLFTVLHTMCITIAPILPIISEKIWLGLGKKTSVHLERWPSINEQSLNENQNTKTMDQVRKICQHVLSLRNKHQIRIRQPLKKLTVYCENHDEIKRFVEILREELNIKQIVFSDQYNEVSQIDISLNFPIVGKKYPKEIKELNKQIRNKNYELLNENSLKVNDIILTHDEFKIKLNITDKQSTQIDDDKIIVSLDTTIDKDIELEGIARDTVRFIQQTRKDADLSINQYIYIYIKSNNPNIKESLKIWKTYILEQTLGKNIYITDNNPKNSFANRKVDTNTELWIELV